MNTAVRQRPYRVNLSTRSVEVYATSLGSAMAFARQVWPDETVLSVFQVSEPEEDGK